ncbi:MAG: RnfABCDGE type electron transport complex subunit D [Candidatus Omnitrophica bacterium]|nr:RnfABCDGE type electron transport complex subunit D [Candidatus Omnitrophota bacterium]
MRYLPKSIKAQLIIYLFVFAVFLALKERDFAFLAAVAIAVIAAVSVESLILYFKTKKLQIAESSVITGLIIGCVVASDEAWWMFILAASLAISSKYILRFQKKHIFNPAAFGIFLTIILFGVPTEWKGTYLWYILVPFGIYFAYKIRKLEIVLGYTIISLLLFGTQDLLRELPLGNIFGYFSYFYIFVMVIEPKTTPVKSLEKYIFGAGLAVLIFVLTEAGARFDVELFSLLVMNASVPILNRIRLKREVLK